MIFSLPLPAAPLHAQLAPPPLAPPPAVTPGRSSPGTQPTPAPPLAAQAHPSRQATEDWRQFRQRFCLPDGRVIDDVNNFRSHSEGQAYSMLAAVYFDDRDWFETCWSWTRQHLQVRGHDRLLAWWWRPDNPGRLPGGGRVADINNASDADTLAAWALLHAAERWQQPQWRRQALEIVTDLRNHQLKRLDNGLLILLPAREGFEHGNQTTINLSYWVFPAFKDFATVDDHADPWHELIDSGLRLIEAARFGPDQLPPDWLRLDAGQMRPCPTHPPAFSYDAIRIPLYLAWFRDRRLERRLFHPFADLGRHMHQPQIRPDPTAVVWLNGAPADPLHPLLPGMRDVLHLADARTQGAIPAVGRIEPTAGYYSSILQILVHVALNPAPPLSASP